jgi:hypothetical protein
MVEFVWGASLLDLFSPHYKEFLLDSGVLTTYPSVITSKAAIHDQFKTGHTLEGVQDLPDGHGIAISTQT